MWRVCESSSSLNQADSSHHDGYVVRLAYNNDDYFISTLDSEARDAIMRDYLEFTTEEGETRWIPAKAACNGREMRRVLSVVDLDGERFKLLGITDDNISSEA